MTKWPSPQDYREAIQSPNLCFADEELRNGRTVLDSLQLPKVHCGQFAAVFQLDTGQSKWAVRCFLNNLSDRSERYQRISEFINACDIEHVVGFQLINRGIKVNGDWFPILKMQFVEGLTLGDYIRKRVSDSTAIRNLLMQFETMMCSLKEHGVAHGDLQHDNIMVSSDGKIKLVDYDGMYVPTLATWASNELGHRNYQHPARSGKDFGPCLDNFSAWLIKSSLEILIEKPSLFLELNRADEYLLFRHADLISPRASETFWRLENQGGSIPELSQRIRFLLSQPLEQITFIDQPAPTFNSLPSVFGPQKEYRMSGAVGILESEAMPLWLESWLLDLTGTYMEIVSDLPPEKILHAIVTATNKDYRNLWSRVGRSGRIPVVAKINGNNFTLHYFTNSAARDLQGVVENHEGGSKIKYRLQMPIWKSIWSVRWFVIAIALCTLWSNFGYPQLFWALSITFLIGLVFFLIVQGLDQANEQGLEEFIREIAAGTKVYQAVSKTLI